MRTSKSAGVFLHGAGNHHHTIIICSLGSHQLPWLKAISPLVCKFDQWHFQDFSLQRVIKWGKKNNLSWQVLAYLYSQAWVLSRLLLQLLLKCQVTIAITVEKFACCDTKDCSWPCIIQKHRTHLCPLIRWVHMWPLKISSDEQSLPLSLDGLFWIKSG